ncbi:UAP56-interacting factor-like isoform X2 [Hyperolius riggenbachi]|uniref:UAP56-interacting factor-like isoform X2 n=1 Tax=Hyperolius riggenbachi TaxID=752182 RepID=UPI0035A315C2
MEATVAMEEEQVLAGEEFQEGNKKIDMSLDDIIKLQKEELDPRRPPSTQAGQNGDVNIRRGRFFKGPPRNQQGPGRPKLGFKQQRYPIANTRNNAFGPVTRRRAAAYLSNVSPLNRPKIVQNFGPGQTQKMQPMTKKYRSSAAPLQTLSRRNNLQNRMPQRRPGQGQQRTTAISQGRTLTQQVSMNRNRRQLNTRRWQNNDGLGTTLTVSVPNPKANRAPQADRPAMRRPAGRFGKTSAHLRGPPPKGVPLRFNFRAMANHTNVTLNERFSTLKIKGQFTPARRGGRTVTLA